jgi:hypothetical protein
MSRLMVNGWFILLPVLITAALITGTCLSALIGNLFEWRWQTVARLGAPIIDPQKPIASIASVLGAGPYLLVNEAIMAHRERTTRWPFTICALIFASLWCLAIGILSLEFLWQITHFE